MSGQINKVMLTVKIIPTIRKAGSLQISNQFPTCNFFSSFITVLMGYKICQLLSKVIVSSGEWTLKDEAKDKTACRCFSKEQRWRSHNHHQLLQSPCYCNIFLVSNESNWIRWGCDLIKQQVINSLTLYPIIAAVVCMFSEVWELIGRSGDLPASLCWCCVTKQ